MNSTAVSLKAAKSKTVGCVGAMMMDVCGGGRETAAPGSYLWLLLSGRQLLNASVSHTCVHLAGAPRSPRATPLHSGRSRIRGGGGGGRGLGVGGGAL